jgi:surface carbohydrate biosynthesis protein
MKKIKVGLVVDHPHRDLEGLILVAAQLAKSNFEVLLIPMYKQRFVAKYQSVDIIVINYLRPNNLETFLDFKRAGIKVAILDTEGVGGRDFEEFADLVSQTKMTHLIDLYMFWGLGQMNAVEKRGLVRAEKAIVTGCPRYDFFAEPWSRTIESNIINDDFILFNTNFPTVNPKFSKGKEDEYQTLLRVGFAPALARELVDQNAKAFAGMKALIKLAATGMPAQMFVLRPHPFEDLNGYDDLSEFSNIEVVQHGSANSWISNSKCLVHLNCSTAVEAALMGKVVLSPAWLDNSAIHRALPDALSRSVGSIEEMIEILNAEENLTELASMPSGEMVPALIQKSFHNIDGKSASRVAEAIIGLANKSCESVTVQNKTISKIVKSIVLNMTDRPILWQIKERLKKLHKNKYFTSNDANIILKRLSKVEPAFASLIATDRYRVQTIQSRFSDLVAVSLEEFDIRHGQDD